MILINSYDRSILYNLYLHGKLTVSGLYIQFPDQYCFFTLSIKLFFWGPVSGLQLELPVQY